MLDKKMAPLPLRWRYDGFGTEWRKDQKIVTLHHIIAKLYRKKYRGSVTYYDVQLALFWTRSSSFKAAKQRLKTGGFDAEEVDALFAMMEPG